MQLHLREWVRRSALVILASCAADVVEAPQTVVSVREAALDADSITIACEAVPGDGRGKTPNACSAARPGEVRAIDFEVLPNPFENGDTIYRWTIAMPPGEALSIVRGCSNSRFCSIAVAPSSSGAPRTYIASMFMTEEFQSFGRNATATATVGPAPSGPSRGPVETTVGGYGGTITLPDVGTAIFPTGAFSTSQDDFYTASSRVRLEATQSPETDQAWQLSAALVGASNRTQYEVRITTAIRPTTGAGLSFKLPSGYVVPPDAALRAFGQLYLSAGQDVTDVFHGLTSTFASQERVMQVNVPAEAFTNARSGLPDQFEAVVLLATIPRALLSPSSATPISAVASVPLPSVVASEQMAATMSMAGAASSGDSPADACPGALIGPPLDVLRVASFFGDKGHRGVDYSADIGTPVLAVANGVIELIGNDERPLKVPDPRSKKLIKGYGRFIVLKHDDAARSLYGHLKADGILVRQGERVVQGQEIALSGDTGGVEREHLHFEYLPLGPFDGPLNQMIRVDPSPCVVAQTTQTESPTGQIPGTPGSGGNPGAPVRTRVIQIGIADSGNLKDDSFEIFLNGQTCRTDPGQSKICRFTVPAPIRIRPSIICLVAPDGVGTIGVQLGPGLVFADNGSTFISGNLIPGRSGLIPVIDVR